MTDGGLRYVLVACLSEATRHVLRAGSRMEDMDINQLHCARAVLTDDTLDAGAVTQLSCISQHNAASASRGGVLCLASNQPNHNVRDCLARRGGRRICRGNRFCFTCGTFHVLKKRIRGGGISASLLSGSQMKVALPTVLVTFNDVDREALTDTNCTKCLCVPDEPKETFVWWL